MPWPCRRLRNMGAFRMTGRRYGKTWALAEFGDLFVAERDGRLLGAVVYLRPGAAKADIFRSEWAVMRLQVEPDARSRAGGRQGTGRDLPGVRANGRRRHHCLPYPFDHAGGAALVPAAGIPVVA